jgi:hypothetical protein
MQRLPRQLLLLISAALVFMLVWSRVQIWVRINVSLWQALLLFLVAVAGLYLLLDHLINRNR